VSTRTLLLAGAIVVAAGAFVVWSGSRGPAATPVDVGTPTRQAKFRSTVTASGQIVATRYADIGSSVMGKIVSLPVAEGDAVAAGQILARIDAVQAESDLAGATAQVRALEAEERAAADGVAAATAALAAAEARARDTAQQFERSRELMDQGLVPAREFESARAAGEAAPADVESAKAAVDRARRALDAATRRVAQAVAQRRRAADIVEKTDIVSPIDGIVTRLNVRAGEMVVVGIQNQPGTTLMTISDLGAIDAEVNVAEADVLRLRPGQPAEVTLEALPGRRFTGRVVEIGASALPLSGTAAAVREFRVVVRLDDPEAGLRPGLTADAEITTSEREHVLTVPLQSVVLRPDDGGGERTGVFAVDSGVARFVPVHTGIIGGLAIEVDGLDEGTPIVVGPYQVLRELEEGTSVRAGGGS
jgi:HlyD family secretion protein